MRDFSFTGTAYGAPRQPEHVQFCEFSIDWSSPDATGLRSVHRVANLNASYSYTGESGTEKNSRWKQRLIARLDPFQLRTFPGQE